MPSRAEAAAMVEAAIGEKVLASADAQSVESRYSQTVRAGGAATAIALRQMKRHATPDDAVELPRFMTVAVTGSGVHFVCFERTGSPPVRKGAPHPVEAKVVGFVASADGTVDIEAGALWTRVLVRDVANARSYLFFQARFTPGRGPLLEALMARLPAPAA